MSCFSHLTFGQKNELILVAKDTIQNRIVSEIYHTKKHLQKKDALDEIDRILQQVKKRGFFTARIDSISKTNKELIAYLDLGKKINEIIIVTKKDNTNGIIDSGIDSIKIKTREFSDLTNQLLEQIDRKGNSFSEITYVNPLLKNDTLFLEMKISNSSSRKIDKVITRGYEDFPKKFITKYFLIDKNTVFSKQKLNQVSALSNKLDFIKEKKAPEVLFKKDSTHLYLFLDKIGTSSFDGLVNFSSKENGKGLLLNGNLDLKLNNTFNTGEKIEIIWNKVSDEKTDFKINSYVPYILNSKFSTTLEFYLYRQDSTFINTNFELKTDYSINQKSHASILYSSEKSNYLLNISNNDLASYSNYFIGLGYELKKSSTSNLYKYKNGLNLNLTIGKRKTDRESINQLKFHFSAFANVQINNRGYLNIKNESGLLTSKNYLLNELFRIGGANSIRGYNEQSIFTNGYSYSNIEFRYSLDTSSYLYSITDLGGYKENTTNKIKKLLGIGAGYQFRINNNLVNLGYVISTNSSTNAKLNSSRLVVRWTSFFY
ncbi:hypothetical protein OAP87_01045 [Flavobacteriaceae bacterium]|nr:hypothetical protein [Flavobacteriaceae bacterium]